MKKFLFLILFIVLIISSFVVVADSDLPIGLSKIKEQNRIDALNILKNVSFIIAFLAGILSIFSPCLLPILPAFFAYTFKEKRNITKMTLAFFFGFSLIFVLFGVIASFLGQSFSILQKNNQILILLVGIFLIIFGLMSLFGKGFSGFKIFKKKPRNDFLGIFLFGIGFSVGWSVCLGPILGGILLMAGVLGNLFYAALLLFVYSLGVFIPLFFLSFLFDKYNLLNNKYVRGRVINIFGFKVHSTNLIAGLLLMVIGLVFIIYRGTSFINAFDPLRTRDYFYLLQKKLIGFSIGNVIGLIILIIFLFLLWRFLRKKKRRK